MNQVSPGGKGGAGWEPAHDLRAGWSATFESLVRGGSGGRREQAGAVRRSARRAMASHGGMIRPGERRRGTGGLYGGARRRTVRAKAPILFGA